MNDVARTVLIAAISGLIAFGGAVLYLGGPSDPPLTRADVQAMIPPPVNVQAVIDSQPFPAQRAYDAFAGASLYANCKAWALHVFHTELWHVESRPTYDSVEEAEAECWDAGLERFRNPPTP